MNARNTQIDKNSCSCISDVLIDDVQYRPVKQMLRTGIAATLTCVAKTTKGKSHYRSERSLGHIKAEKSISFNYQLENLIGNVLLQSCIIGNS